jgi:hypothetical protein
MAFVISLAAGTGRFEAELNASTFCFGPLRVITKADGEGLHLSAT